MEINDIQEAGLTPGEAKIYIALLDMKSATPSKIVTVAKISPSKVYDILQRLVRKGLVSVVIHGTKREYRAADPEQLLLYMKSREKELNAQKHIISGILPSLQQRFRQSREAEGAEIFEGIHGIKTVFEKSLRETKKEDTIYLLGYPKLASTIFDTYNKEFHTRRAKSGIKMKALFNKEAWFAKEREPRKLIQNKYLPENIITPAFLIIFNNTVGNIIVTENQKTCIVIQNKEVAESYKKYFEMLWKQAVSP